MTMKKGLLLFVIVWLNFSAIAGAEELDTDYTDIQNVIDSITQAGESISFSEIVSKLVSGEMEFSFSSLGQYVFDKIFSEINANKNALIQIIGISIIGAVFTNFSMAFSKNQVAETGFYLTYMILISLLTTSFIAASSIAGEIMEQLIHFMSALIPTFCLAITFSTGVSTSAGYYQLMILLIGIVDWIMSKIIMNLINIYVILAIVNNISKEDYISKLTDLIKTITKWSLKTILGVTLGLNMIQSMILPAFDSVKSSLLLKASSVIPGVGNALNVAAKTVIGSGVLIKNAIGVGGLIVIIILCAVPLLKLIVISFMYQVAEAAVQPVSDDRIVKSIHIVSEGVSLLLGALGTAILLFVLSLAIITSASNLQIGG